MAELKPCPFCGCEVVTVVPIVDYYHGRIYEAECNGCGARVRRFFVTKAAAAEAWNRRAEPKRGRWESSAEMAAFPCCSECGVFVDDDFDFCPNCGADMRE